MSTPQTVQTTRRIAINVLFLVNGLSATVVSAVAPVLPEVYRAFADVPNARLQVDIFLSIAALFLAFAGPMMAPLARRRGKVQVLAGSLLVFALAGAASAVLPNLPSMIASRALVGIGAAGIMTTSMALLLDQVGPDERNAMIGRQAATMGAASVVGSLLGGWLADANWRFAFLPFLAGLPGAVLCLAYVKERGTAIQPAVAGGKTPVLVSAGWMYLLIGLSISLFSLVLLYTPFRLKEIGVTSSSSKGLAIGAFLLVCSAMSLLYHRIKSRMAHASVFSCVYLFAGAGSALLYASGSFAAVVTSLVVCAVGWGLFLPNATAVLMNRVPPAARMAAAGGLGMSVYLGQFASPFLGGYFARTVGIVQTFAGAAALLLVAGLVAWFCQRRSSPAGDSLGVAEPARPSRS